MAPKIYYCSYSVPSRSTLLTIKALGLDDAVELIHLDLLKQEHLAPEFIKINPHHTVPTLEDDGGFVLWDSHAINCFLAEKYGKKDDDSLYPRNLQERAVIHQRQHFDSNVVAPRLRAITDSIRHGARTVAKDKADALINAYNLLETLLEKHKYVAGNSLTIADFSLAATISSTGTLVPVASNRFPKIHDWLSRLESLPYYSDINGKGNQEFAAVYKSKLV